ncbi:MAG: protein kinase [Myxococcales bacterium]
MRSASSIAILKPDNIFLCQRPDGEWHPKVLDFGVAKTLTPASREGHSLTRPGALLGSPAYMSIEQIDALEVDVRADVYAFGVILYRCLAGVLPYDHQSLSQLIAQICAGTPKPLREHVPSIAPELEAAIARAMARDARARFATLEQLRSTLLPFRQLARIDEESGIRVMSGARRASRSKLAWGLALLTLLVAATGWLLGRPSAGPVQRAEAHEGDRQPSQAPLDTSVPVPPVPNIITLGSEPAQTVEPVQAVEPPAGSPPESASREAEPKRLRRPLPARKVRAVYEPPLL